MLGLYLRDGSGMLDGTECYSMEIIEEDLKIIARLLGLTSSNIDR